LFQGKREALKKNASWVLMKIWRIDKNKSKISLNIVSIVYFNYIFNTSVLLCLDTSERGAANQENLRNMLKNTAIYCNLLQFTAIYCNLLQILQNITKFCEILQNTAIYRKYTAKYCKILQNTAKYYKIPRNTAKYFFKICL
jgi:hypothetical protein